MSYITTPILTSDADWLVLAVQNCLFHQNPGTGGRQFQRIGYVRRKTNHGNCHPAMCHFHAIGFFEKGHERSFQVSRFQIGKSGRLNVFLFDERQFVSYPSDSRIFVDFGPIADQQSLRLSRICRNCFKTLYFDLNLAFTVDASCKKADGCTQIIVNACLAPNFSATNFGFL